jgi:hypothetical protein
MVKWNIGIKVAAIDWWWVEILFVDMKTRLSGGAYYLWVVWNIFSPKRQNHNENWSAWLVCPNADAQRRRLYHWFGNF